MPKGLLVYILWSTWIMNDTRDYRHKGLYRWRLGVITHGKERQDKERERDTETKRNR